MDGLDLDLSITLVDLDSWLEDEPFSHERSTWNDNNDPSLLSNQRPQHLQISTSHHVINCGREPQPYYRNALALALYTITLRSLVHARSTLLRSPVCLPLQGRIFGFPMTGGESSKHLLELRSASPQKRKRMLPCPECGVVSGW